MIKTLSKIYQFSGKMQGTMKKAILFSVLHSLFDMMSFGALAMVFSGLTDGFTTSMIWMIFGITLASMLLKIYCSYISDFGKVQIGYFMCAEKRIHIGDRMKYMPIKYFNNHNLKNLTSIITTTINNIKKTALLLSQKKDLYILGRGSLLASTLEFALKIKEVSYLHAEGFSAGELKHGVIALIEKETPVICLVDKANRENMLSSAHEVKARGAQVIGIASKNEEIFDLFIELPQNEKFTNLSSIIVAQLLAYEIALIKKLDPDKPRNLAKSVTVK